MKNKLSDYLKIAFPAIKNKTRLGVIIVIFLILGITFSKYVTSILFLAAFIFIGSISKIYHRFFKSSIGIDLVFFTTIIISLVYKNIFFSLANAWLGLLIADSIAQKFSYTSIVSLIGLTIISLIARFMPFSLIISAIILTILFEIYSIVSYILLGSPVDKIIIYFITHFTFNMFLIFSFAQGLAGMMV